jgi:hypothetical protein
MMHENVFAQQQRNTTLSLGDRSVFRQLNPEYQERGPDNYLVVPFCGEPHRGVGIKRQNVCCSSVPSTQ